MDTPSELIRRAKRSQLYRNVRRIQPQAACEAVSRPLPTSHASYTRLMQSHDRMRTRHLSKPE